MTPIKVMKQKKKAKQVDKEVKERLEELNTIWENIDAYDGTSKGQKELRNIETGL